MRVAYVLNRYPQVSQTFVRDEIWAHRHAGLDVDVVVLEAPLGDVPDADWAGPFRSVGRPALRRALADHLWWARTAPRRYAGFLRSVFSLRERQRYGLLRLPTEARALRERQLTALHTHFAWTTASSVVSLGRLLELPVTITVHARDLYAQPARVVRRRLDQFSRIVTVCHYNVGYMEGRGLVAAADARVSVIPCSVAAPGPEGAEAGPGADLVAVGRLIPKKGFDVLLRALARVDATARLVIVGDGPERDALAALAAELAIDDRVEFAGARPHDETLAIIGSGRVFCLPARPSEDGDSDAMPVVIREAMVRGVPVVTSRLAGIPESVDESVGWLVAAGAEDDLRQALHAALTDDQARRQRGDAARRRAVELWSPEDQARALEAVFAAAAGAGRAV